ncbi:MAG: hypothetical protein U5R30_10955 [Deltaproteobacteria bacterium]|nr:hypothetical protein [Deltaproteobacteria bacterium]
MHKKVNRQTELATIPVAGSARQFLFDILDGLWLFFPIKGSAGLAVWPGAAFKFRAN